MKSIFFTCAAPAQTVGQSNFGINRVINSALKSVSVVSCCFIYTENKDNTGVKTTSCNMDMAAKVNLHSILMDSRS